jgi:hypothetical protein
MSKQSALPTPAPSSEIQPHSLAAIDSLALPPAALSSATTTRNSSIASTAQSPPSTYSPITPPPSTPSPTKQTAGSKRKSSAIESPSQEYVLPPPPTRSRKIIQMKPRQSSKDDTVLSPNGPRQPAIAPAPAAASVASTAPPASKRKQAPGSTTAAGRKMARKTAHSLIERRRRSKMNEEFGVLKDMIPACTGQDMHKLAILQASIQYMRYLETCLADLKSAHEQCPRQGAKTAPSMRTPSEDQDQPQPLPPLRQAVPANRLPSVSPALPPSTRPPPHGFSLLASPTEASPPEPQMPEDREATAALLMLNTDRRSWGERRGGGGADLGARGRGMSVRELLS